MAAGRPSLYFTFTQISNSDSSFGQKDEGKYAYWDCQFQCQVESWVWSEPGLVIKTESLPSTMGVRLYVYILSKYFPRNILIERFFINFVSKILKIFPFKDLRKIFNYNKIQTRSHSLSGLILDLVRLARLLVRTLHKGPNQWITSKIRNYFQIWIIHCKL